MQSADALSQEIARKILDGFESHFAIFYDITKNAKTCFEQADWQQIRGMIKKRIYFYEERIRECTDFLLSNYDFTPFDKKLWANVKQDYIRLIVKHQQPELAETFFNSVFCHCNDKQYYNNDYIFVRPSVSKEYIDLDAPVISSVCVETSNIRQPFATLLKGFKFQCPFQDFERDTQRLEEQFRLNYAFDTEQPFEIQFITEPFFRNKAAYLIGKIVCEAGVQPLCIAILHDKDKGIYVDALLMTYDGLSLLMSFTRSYFLVKTTYPAAVVSFLKSILPDEKEADLYSIIGFHKQGKTLFYRMFLRYIQMTSETLKVSPGITGMVMLVFSFPVYPYVFKVIRDTFKPPKQIDREEVKRKYRVVKNHERIGRLADTWEFTNVAFPLNKIDPELLDELKREATSSIDFKQDLLIIKHLYIEKKMKPLNLYLQEADDANVERMIKGYGTAIKDLIYANIFPGDLLLKNFGVTKQNRVIFYDYDEISHMNEVNFRRIPEPRTPEEEMAAEPWYHVAKNDVFPEEFLRFLFTTKKTKEIFLKYHADLLDASYWQQVQKRVTSGEIRDVFPYSEKYRMHRIYNHIDK